MRLSQSEMALVANFVSASTAMSVGKDRKRARKTVISRLKRSSPQQRVEIYGGMTRWLDDFNRQMVSMRGRMAQMEGQRRAGVMAQLQRRT